MNMYYKIILLVGVLVATGCAVSKNPLRQQVKLLQEGIIKDDTSYVYACPMKKEKLFGCYKVISPALLTGKELLLILT